MKSSKVLVLAFVALLLSPALPALAGPAAAGCLTVVDPKGDTTPAPDPALDLVGFTLTNKGPRIVAAVTVDKASVRPMYAPDSRTEVNFTVGAKRVTLFYKSSLQREAEKTAFFQQGIRVDDVFASGDMDATLTGNTLTMKVKLTVLRTVLAQKVEGVGFTGIQAAARANYLYQDANVTVDSANTTQKFVAGAPC